jgi:hypothetical protein
VSNEVLDNTEVSTIRATMALGSNYSRRAMEFITHI